ncbi:hypothetical protein NQ318_023371 [Aromia moschata]|uniref:Uncharacterized protein n=1 Tax=Aromia moschata TaxID=1265417 RepID=A0AAV8XA04_9CUCU|nr:hypothetical protein NQ318_023371 [Aromia moschata]
MDTNISAKFISPRSRAGNKEVMSLFKNMKLTSNDSFIWHTLKHPKNSLEQIGIQTFIDGLVDTEMQQALRLGRHTTISDALVAALEFKAAKEASRSYKSRIKVTMQRENQDTQVREMSNQNLSTASMMNESVISRNKNRSICVNVMNRLKKEFYLYWILRKIPAMNC